MEIHPNNTLAQYITNLPRRISLYGEWEYGLTEIHYPHDWYNVRNARFTVEQDGNVETDVCFEDGYYDSPKGLATTLNGEKPGRVIFYYEPVTQKVVAHMKGDTKVALYGDLPDILGFMRGDAITVLCEPSERSDSTQPCVRTVRLLLSAPCNWGSRRRPSARMRICYVRDVS